MRPGGGTAAKSSSDRPEQSSLAFQRAFDRQGSIALGSRYTCTSTSGSGPGEAILRQCAGIVCSATEFLAGPEVARVISLVSLDGLMRFSGIGTRALQ